MTNKISKNFSFDNWSLFNFLKGRKKLVITGIGLVCAQLAFNPALTGLLAGGAVFEGLWAIVEYYFKQVEIK